VRIRGDREEGTGTGTSDTGAGAGLISDLRYCISQANLGGNNTIQFDSTVFAAPAPQSISLALGQLELSDTSGTETIWPRGRSHD
jgi:hypothetical protein